MTTEEIATKLQSSKSADRERAANAICKLKLTDLAEDLFAAFLKDTKENRSSYTRCAMIKALGVLDFKKALPEIKKIVVKNFIHDTLTGLATTCYIQLKRKSIHDGEPVIDALKFGRYSVINGALFALAVDQMVPKENEIKEIIKLCKNINKHKDRIGHEYGLIDSRIYLALACANWDPKLTIDFLNHCIVTAIDIDVQGKPYPNQKLVDVCNNSLNGKFSKKHLS